MRKLLSLTAFLVFAMLFALEFWRGSQSAVLANNISTTKTPLVDPQNPFDALYATNTNSGG